MTGNYSELAGVMTFTVRPAPLPARLRPARRTALVLLYLNKCRGQRATQLQLHALDTAVEDAAAREALSGHLRGLGIDPIIRYDPALLRAVDLAVGFGYARWERGDRLLLTDIGRDALDALLSQDVLSAEKAALAAIPGRLTQTAVSRVTERTPWL